MQAQGIVSFRYWICIHLILGLERHNFIRYLWWLFCIFSMLGEYVRLSAPFGKIPGFQSKGLFKYLSKTWKFIIMGKDIRNTNSSDAVYGFGFIGAVIYYVSQATSFTAGVIGILKAIVWPAFLVYELFTYLHLWLGCKRFLLPILILEDLQTLPDGCRTI